jgi:hypothetical protein
MSDNLDHAEISKKGGKATLALHGKSHYSMMGKKGSASLKKKYGDDYFLKLAAKGLVARLKKSSNKKRDNHK